VLLITFRVVPPLLLLLLLPSLTSGSGKKGILNGMMPHLQQQQQARVRRPQPPALNPETIHPK
jgi:hypothetical protein